jgi:methyl-accepting chemotaxis protein
MQGQIMQLSEQTDRIGNISSVVSDLANQTNMLALNAAVEAVRAGEHGKGFGVVASEIRKLSDRSKKSATQINLLVADIQKAINSTVMVTDEGTKTVESGVNIASETAAAFAGVANAINNVVLSSQQVSLNAKQQAVAIEQVVEAMNSLNQAAAQTASGITQTKVGTQKLNEAALDLKAII